MSILETIGLLVVIFFTCSGIAALGYLAWTGKEIISQRLIVGRARELRAFQHQMEIDELERM